MARSKNIKTTTSLSQENFPIKNFSPDAAPLIEQPNLNEIQIKSYNWFLNEGIKNVFKEISPIKDTGGKDFELYFEDYYFEEPKLTEEEAKYKDANYDAALKVKLRLVNHHSNKEEVQEVYLGNFPKMTSRGTFIINGVERVVISQLVRSAGVYFSAIYKNGRKWFGAKIIPNRGAWIEFETDLDGVIGVKIDRHRKAPVTDLLRIFGLEDNQSILKYFSDVDNGQIKYIEKTLSKDTSKSVDQSYLEIYKRIRPGDLATAQNAKSLIDSMFKRNDRYDLSNVGRYKINQRLGLNSKDMLLSLDDIGAIVKEIIRLNNDPEANPDDIDHLGNRRVRPVGELLDGRLRLGMNRVKRIIQDRMSTAFDKEHLMPAQLINFRSLMAVMEEFFATSQLSQFMDQANPLAEVEHRRRISALGPGGLTRERASFEVRDVHHSYYGRICPIQTPEGTNIGLINYLASFARVDDLGFIRTPYIKVKKGKITDEVVWLDAFEEEKYIIVHAGVKRDKNKKILGSNLEARIKGNPGFCSADEVDLIEVAPNQFASMSTSLIPFLQHDDANRALMGSNMQRQAVIIVKPEIPLVSTGFEEKIARDCGYLISAEESGKIIEVDRSHIKMKTDKGEIKNYKLEIFKKSNDFMAISNTPKVNVGQRVEKGDILADGPSIKDGVLSLGRNLVVAFLSFDGGNFEDAVILSERVVKEDFFTSIHMEDFYVDVQDTKLGPERTTADIPNVSEEKLANLDEEGIIRIGAEVKEGDYLVGKISPKGESDLTPEEKLLRAIFGEKVRDVKDTSLVLPHGKFGRVIGVKVFSRDKGDKLEPGVIKRIQIEIAQLRKVQIGDKLAGRHGNKGVISQIRPVEDMPYLEDGTPVDIILNPLGVISRMNLGQILETQLGLAAKNLGYRAVIPSLSKVTEEDIKSELKKANLPEDNKVVLYDGRSGRKFDQKVMVGVIYMMKLHHFAEDKIHMRSIGPYSLITQQPLGGKSRFGGQRFGEMEVWALEGYGAKHVLQEMLTIKSDDVAGRTAVYESIIRGEVAKFPNLPSSFNVLISELKSLALDVIPKYSKDSLNRPEDLESLTISLASPEKILSWSHGEVIKPETINYRTQRPEKDGLFSERIFGPVKDYECYCGKYKKIRYKGVVCEKCGVEVTRSIVRRERMGHIELATPVAHLWFFKTVPSRIALIMDISSNKLERVIYYISYIVTQVNEEAKKKAFEDIDKELKLKTKSLAKNDKMVEELNENAKKLKDFLKQLKVGMVLDQSEYLFWSKKFSSIFEANTGAEAVRKILEKIDLRKEVQQMEKKLAESKNFLAEKKILQRLKIFRSMIRNNIRPEWMVLTVLPVMPPDLRPMVPLDGGRYASSDLNDLYRRVINRNNRLKKLIEINAPDIIVKNEKRMLQEAVDALIDNSAHYSAQQMSSQRRPLKSLSDILRGKQGRFRQNLLGKRVDYSGRAVIVVGPKLKINECGLPKKMALEIFKPFVISKIISQGLAHNIRSANNLIDQGTNDVWAILEEVIKDKRVLLNRAPTLHRLSIQAFKPILVEGLAIQIPPLVCTAFNADFDGDMMAVHLPLSIEAQEEAEKIMDARLNVLKPSTGEIITNPTQDIVLGIYYMTNLNQEVTDDSKIKYFASINEALVAYENNLILINTPIKTIVDNKVIKTSLGRLIFNEIFEGKLEFVNEKINKKKLSNLVESAFDVGGLEFLYKVLSRIQALGFYYATESGITWSMNDMIVPAEKEEILAQAEKEVSIIDNQYKEGLLTLDERRARIITIWEKVKEKISNLVKTVLLPTNPIYQIIDSNARGSWAQPIQMMGMKGLVSNPKGETIEFPLKSSFKEGMSVLEYFVSTHGARKGSTDTALRTAQAGYLTRRLVDVSQDLIIREEDCHTKRGIEIHRKDGESFGYSFADQIFSRTALEDIKIGKKVIVPAGEIIDKKAAKIIADSGIESVKVRSPITCENLYGVCSKCYGYDLGVNKPIKVGQTVGVIAAQSIGEPGTQLTMRTFHTGGMAGKDITQGLPRVEEIFEVRPPKGKALLANYDSKVISIEEKGEEKIIKLQEKFKGKQRISEYRIPLYSLLLVKVGDKVKRGDQLTEGSLDLRELLKLRGYQETIRYIIREVQKIYFSQGSAINNKHIEIIVKQMFARVKIIDVGDAPDFTVGEIVEKSRFLEVNRDLKSKGMKPAKAEQLLLGIKRVALSTSSWLSAASFEDTARVLVSSAIEGREDKLRGLKENVIIGRLIPTKLDLGTDVSSPNEGDVNQKK